MVALLAFRALGVRATAVTLTGPAVPAEEVAVARAVATTVGVRHEFLPVDPLTDPSYADNPTNRCYFCRRVEGHLLRAWGDVHGVVQFLDGIHRDDLGDDRPGIRAMEEAGFRHPLVEAGWGKHRIRSYAREQGLPNWDRPSNACLASRVATGMPITYDVLGRIEEAERRVRGLGFRRVRVRVSGTSARIQVDAAEVGRLLSEPTADAVRERLLQLGFATVSLDPIGYRPKVSA